MSAEEQPNFLELVRIARLDRAAGEQLFAEYYDRVRPILHRRVAAKLLALPAHTDIDVDDVLQDVVVTALLSLDRIEPKSESDYIRWLVTLTDMKTMGAVHRSALRRARHEPNVPESSKIRSGDMFRDLVDPIDAPSSHAEDNELRAIIFECMGELPDYARELIVLRDFHGLEWKQIAIELREESLESLRNRHYRAREKLSRAVRDRMNSVNAPKPMEIRNAIDLCFDPSLTDEQVRASIRLLGDFYRSCGGTHLHFEFTEESAASPAAEEVQ